MSYLRERNSENFRYIDFSKFSDKNFVKISFGNCNYTKFSSKKIIQRILKNPYIQNSLIRTLSKFPSEIAIMQSSLRNLYSSNKPGFIEKFNKWVDEKNLLKGGLKK